MRNNEFCNVSSLNINKLISGELSRPEKTDFSKDMLDRYDLSKKDLRGCVFSNSNTSDNWLINQREKDTNFSGSNLIMLISQKQVRLFK